MNPSIEQILEKSHYQTFDFIEGDHRDSDSKGRFEKSRLESFDLVDKNILDVGCNAGYFLFRLLNSGAKSLVGIELGEKFVYVSNELNNQVYKSNKVKVILGDFFDYEFDQHFDLIICFSTFHYFKDNQLFFNKCFELLNKDGILLLEVEEYPENSLNLQRYLNEKFTIINKYKSIIQISHERWFYEFKRL
jgi:tRNA (mo5U34)-methyltransferase